MANALSQNSFNQKLIAPMILGSILNPINSSIISVALIPIGQVFGAPPSQTAWLISALYLATAIGQPVVGKLIDVFGPRRLFLMATTLVGLSSLIAIFAPNLWWLVIARVLLGFGTCAGYPSSMYLIRSEAERTGVESPTSILTTLAISNQTIAVIGPTLGGLLIEFGGWQSTFVVNLPLSIACFALGFVRFPKPKPNSSDDKRTLASIDWFGILFFAVALISGLLFLMNPSLTHLYLLFIGILMGVAFTVFELKVQDPFIDVRVLGGNAPLLMTYARSVITATISYSMLYGYSQWLEKGRGLSPSHAGLLLLPMFLTAIVVSRSTGKSPAIWLKLMVGSLFQCVALILLLFTTQTSPLVFLIGIVLLLGVPQGLLNLANQNAVYYQAVPDQIGASAGLLRTFMYLGALISSSANGLLLKTNAMTVGMHQIAIFTISISMLLILLTVFDRSLKRVGENAQAKILQR